jgi:hypothetical protein
MLPFAAGPLVGALYTTHVWPLYLFTTFAASYLLAPALLRAALRLFPLRADGARRTATLRAAATIILLCVALAVYAASQFRDSTMSIIFGGHEPLILFSASVLTGIAAAAFFSIHWRAPRLLQKPFVLFLRRFGGFSDRSAFIEILRAAPPGIPVCIVGGPMGDASAWDPFLLCFYGRKWRATLRSSPVFVTTNDAEWVAAVSRFVDAAHLVLIDISDTTDSLQIEVQLASQRAPNAVLWLRWSGSDVTLPTTSEKRFLPYQKSWLASLPRLFVGFSLSNITGAFLLLTVGQQSILVEDGHWHVTPEAIHAISNPFILAGVLLAFGPLFFRQSLSRKSVRDLHRVIRSSFHPLAPSNTDTPELPSAPL